MKPTIEQIRELEREVAELRAAITFFIDMADASVQEASEWAGVETASLNAKEVLYRCGDRCGDRAAS